MFQKDVAKLLGVCTDTVTNWEKNRSKPDLRALPNVIKFLGYDPRSADQSMASQLTSLRRARGLSQKELAKIMQIDPSTLSRWEQGKRTPQGLYLQQVRLILDSL